MNRILINITILLTCMMLLGSCNEEWKDEQFNQSLSFVAPLNEQGLSPIYIRYKPNGAVTYELPMLVSGSTMNDKDLNVSVALDPDTLNVLNIERFSTRTELFYKLLPSPQFVTFPDNILIPSGSSHVKLPLNFTLAGIDMVDKWVLPLTIVDGPSYNYTANPMRHYKRALLRIFPFNDYSGNYSATGYRLFFKDTNGNTVGEAITVRTHTGYVVDENTVFFYAGHVNEERLDRGFYKLRYQFNNDFDEDLGYATITITADNPAIKFDVRGTPNYRVEESMDPIRPYLKRRTIVISLEYDFTDYTSIPGVELDYRISGTLTMERQINTQIPDEDQAILW